MTQALNKYRELVAALREARIYGSEATEDSIEDQMLELWDDLSAAERLETEAFAWEAFPEKYFAQSAEFMEPDYSVSSLPRARRAA